MSYLLVFFIFVLYLIDSLIPYSGNNENLWKISHKNINGDDSTDQEFPYIDLASIKISTNNSSDSNKLGEGGFGPVYKVINKVFLYYLFSI